MFLILIVHFIIKMFIVILIAMWAPTGQNTTDVLTLTDLYFIPAVYHVQGLMNV
jgi:hypothetical protein